MNPLTPNQQVALKRVQDTGFPLERAIELVQQAANGAPNLTVDELYDAALELAFEDNTGATYGANSNILELGSDPVTASPSGVQINLDVPELEPAGQPPEQPDHPQDAQQDGCHRPGISDDYLRRHNIRQVGKAESTKLIGYPAPGIAIPYTTLEGEPLIVIKPQQVYRIRLKDPTPGTKYLSPKGSGAPLFIPLGQTFGKEPVIAESEFKAMSLAEAGVPTVGIGGICSAMKEERLIPELADLIAKHPPEVVYFLGDSDTCFLWQFSNEAIKLAKALPKGCQLKLPRIPVTMPVGIDDCKQKLGEGFMAFWKEIKEGALLIDPELPWSALAVRLAVRELPAIAELPDREIQIHRLATLASHLPAVDFGKLASEVNKVLKINKTAFADNAKQIRKQRHQEETERRRESQKLDSKVSVNDSRPRLELPGSRDRLASEFANDIGPILAKHHFYNKDKVVVIPDLENACLQVMLPSGFITEVEKYVIPFKIVRTANGEAMMVNKSLSKEDADITLQSSFLASQLLKIRAIKSIRLPILRSSGQIELLPEGYDPESKIYTLPGGPEIMVIEVKEARKALKELLAEFPFLPDDEPRAISIVLAAMLTLFCFHILPQGSLRPGFIYNANDVGSGKGLLAKIAVITRLGYAAPTPWPESEEEVRKLLFAHAIKGLDSMFFDNAKHEIGGGAIESAITATTIAGRVLGFSKEMDIENMMTVFFTANGAEVSPDMRRRSLQVDLHLEEARSEDRDIEHPLDDAKLIELRPVLLGMLWSLTQHWASSGQHKSSTTLNGFESWSEVIGGILESNGFVSPCAPGPSKLSGDISTSHMSALVAAMDDNKKYEFAELVNLARNHELFEKLVGEVSEMELEPSERKSFSSILKKFRDRLFKDGRWFHRWQRSKNQVFYYVDLKAPESGRSSKKKKENLG